MKPTKCTERKSGRETDRSWAACTEHRHNSCRNRNQSWIMTYPWSIVVWPPSNHVPAIGLWLHYLVDTSGRMSKSVKSTTSRPSGNSCCLPGSICNVLLSLGIRRCGRKRDLVVWATQCLLRPGVVTLIAPRCKITTRNTAVTSYKSLLNWRRVGHCGSSSRW